MSDDQPNDDPRRYDHATIEPKWQRRWDELGVFKAERTPGRPKKYILDMFPYPSGAGLHVGHPEGYTATDILSRFYRMRGVDVLHPMGWDAFGLPAEQYAIQTGTHPSTTTQANIATFKRQLKMLGFSYDWSREVDTTDPQYVRWTQWIFLQLFHRGLAYQDKVQVNWCPALGTVLANEEVVDGKSERGNHPVFRTPLRQWMLRITAYADRLTEDLSLLDWPKGTLAMQREWVGKSEGAEIRFGVAAHDDAEIAVFTTRPDTLMGVTYVVLAPEHPLVAKLTTAAQQGAVDAYVKASARKSDRDRTATVKDKTGVATGALARHPITGAEVPVWVADYVLGGYGTGAVMAVPGHDERDFAFARAFGLPIVEVVSPDGALHDALDAAFTAEGKAVRSGEFDGLTTAACKTAVIAKLEAIGRGKGTITYKLRDWVFSRQRYWGEPIPVFFPVDMADPAGDPRKGAEHTIRYDKPIPVPEAELPLRLPELSDYAPGDDPAGPLARIADWRFFQKDGQWFARETNTMPQWAGSCWYYLRFLDPKNDAEPWSEAAYDAWMPVDCYVGGAEHAVLHLLYARFWHKVLFDIGRVKHPEPFMKLVHQGMILGEIEYTGFRDAESGALVSAELVKAGGDEGGFVHAHSGRPVTAESLKIDALTKRGSHFYRADDDKIRVTAIAHKMSKSRGNVVSPDNVVREFGADVLRLYEMFMGPLEAVKPWQAAQIQGVARFRDRFFAIGTRPLADVMSDETKRAVHKTIKKVTLDVEAMAFNTCISEMMTLLNHLGGQANPPREAIEALTLLVSPFAPHVAEEVWSRTHGDSGEVGDSIARHAWPTFDEALCVDDAVEMAVQVNGKMRGRVTLPRGADEAAARAAALVAPGVGAFTDGKPVKKFIFVPNKIINIIV